MLADMLFKFVS